MVDGYYIRRAQNGDRRALDKFIRRHYDEIYAYCFHRVQDQQTAEDLCQETFIRMLEHIGEYRHYGKALNYLYVIAGNLCRDHYKKKKPELYDEAPESLMQTDSEEEKLLLRTLVEGLPEELQEVISLRFYQDLKYQDMAKILQISSSVAKYRVKKAVSMLREELERSETDE